MARVRVYSSSCPSARWLCAATRSGVRRIVFASPSLDTFVEMLQKWFQCGYAAGNQAAVHLQSAPSSEGMLLQDMKDTYTAQTDWSSRYPEESCIS